MSSSSKSSSFISQFVPPVLEFLQPVLQAVETPKERASAGLLHRASRHTVRDWRGVLHIPEIVSGASDLVGETEQALNEAI